MSRSADDPQVSRDPHAPGDAEEPSQRQYIGDIAISRAAQEASDTTPLRKELRQELVRQFVLKKFRRNLDRHVEHISSSRELADTVKYLFDEHGEPPPNAPIEDIIARRQELESQIRWLDVLAGELRTRLTSLREIEEAALELVEQD
ncbi:hypothetical protein MK489_04175 [Myxococcota bacterium]|nr:hypothetical protein [Myxococcota bacterium]